MSSTLSKKKCTPCADGAEPLKRTEQKSLSNQVGSGWRVIKGHHLEREYKFKDFKQALAFTNRVGKLAEKVGHHPDIFLAWGKVKLTLWTHKIGGLSESDFIFAAKVNHID